jgi:hypothetical protein
MWCLHSTITKKSALACCHDLRGEQDSSRTICDLASSPERDGDCRIIDESGEDYLYPNRYFVAIDLPTDTESVLTESFDRI